MEHYEDLVTVIMSVYKTDLSLLQRAVNSIVNQTYRNIEFVIVDDGANDEIRAYLDALDDRRIRVIHNDHNIGLATSLNKGIDSSNGTYIARMDADDYSLPARIDEQVRYLNAHADVDVLAGISLDIMDGVKTGGIGGAYYRFDNELMKIELSLAPMPFPHPTVMFRKSFLMANSLRYDEAFMRSQDYDMWAECIIYGKLDSLQRVILLYNTEEDKNGVISERQTYYVNQTKIKCLARLLPDASEEEKELYISMREPYMRGSVGENYDLVRKLIYANNKKKIYDCRRYEQVLFFWWGRKLLYSDNRSHLLELLVTPGMLVRILLASIRMLPGHIIQKVYVARLRKKLYV